MDPVGREAGREDRDGDEEPSKASGPGVAEHQPPVGGNVRAADLDGAVHVLGFVDGRDQVFQKVVYGDGLDAGVDPLWADHNGEALHQVANHLEGDAAGADDDGGAELGDGNAAFPQGLAGFLSGAKVGRKVGLGVSEAAEVDDAVDASLLGGYAEVAGGLQVQFLKAGGPCHAVDEVVGAIDALQGFR